jgi:hypothetical protein
VNTALKSRTACLMIVGLLVGSILGPVSSASAAPCKPLACGGSTIAGPDLSVSVSASPNPVVHGALHTYVLNVTNMTWRSTLISAPQPFPGADLSNVRVHLSGFPSNETLVSSSNSNGFICYQPAEFFGMDVRCVSGTVPTLSTAQITIVMHAPTTLGAFTSTARVDPYSEISESNENNNTATVSFSVN